MHYYKRDIGKYYKKAGRLTMLQHGAYTMLMDACYDREVFPDVNQAIDWCWASSKEEIDAVNFVLSKFFTEYEGVFKQSHITETLDKYHANKAINKTIAVNREADKRTKRARSVDGSITNEHLITNKELLITNQELRTKDQDKPENLKVSMPNDFELNDTNKNWMNDSNLTLIEKQEAVKDFIDYWFLDESKKTAKGWQMAFRKNPVVKRKIVNSKHRGQSNGAKGQGQNTRFDTRSRAKKVSDRMREIGQRDIDENGFANSLGGRDS